jgi:hypothetical protein
MRCPACGWDCGSSRSSKRSLQDHKRLFAIIGRAYQNWPEDHEFQPQSVDNLRYWLTCKAGPEFRNVRVHFLPDRERSLIVETVKDLLKTEIDKFPVEYKDGLAVITPKSISFETMPQAEFSKLRDAITDLIEATLGCKVEELTKEAA